MARRRQHNRLCGTNGQAERRPSTPDVSIAGRGSMKIREFKVELWKDLPRCVVPPRSKKPLAALSDLRVGLQYG